MFTKKVKKMLCVALASMSVMSIGVTAFAANPSYDFYLQNTGKKYTYDAGSANNKVYAAQRWSLYVGAINFSNGYAGYGMSFAPIKSNLTMGGNPVWRTSVGTSYGTYGDYGGAIGTYYLGARIDDDLSGYGAASGRWNSDYVNF